MKHQNYRGKVSCMTERDGKPFERGREWFSIVNDLQPEDFIAEEWVSVWRDFMGLDDYVVVTADKPRLARA